MSQEDYAASLFTSSILGLILLPCLYFLKRSCSKGSKCSLITWLSLTLLLSLLLSNSISDLLNAEESKVPFDPYEILSVSPLSSEKEIRSSFRELSKKFHPDKNPDHKDYYLKITKAYETLTDAKAKHNYETYGNPDGPSVFKVIFP
jgi:translocation protein SEC63